MSSNSASSSSSGSGSSGSSGQGYSITSTGTNSEVGHVSQESTVELSDKAYDRETITATVITALERPTPTRTTTPIRKQAYLWYSMSYE